MTKNQGRPLVEQEATNTQTMVFVADRQAEIASQADNLAKKRPDFSAIAAVEREHRKTLMEMANEERQLATAIQLGTHSPERLAVKEREHRMELLQIARAEGELAARLVGLDFDDPTVDVLAEQALRNEDLLRLIAGMERRADATLRAGLGGEAEAQPKWT